MNEIKTKLNKIRDSIVVPQPDEIIDMYKIHKYWARKPWYLVNRYIKEFTKIGEHVYDPFAGSGVTGVEATVLKRNSTLVDLNPVSTFVTKMTLINHNISEKLVLAFNQLEMNISDEINSHYAISSICSNCKKNLIGEYFRRGPKYNKVSVKAFCLNCGKRKSQIDIDLSKEDTEKLDSFENKAIQYWFPTNKFPEKFDKDRITYKGIPTVDKLYTVRNLYNLSYLLDSINKINDESVRNLFLLSFSDTLLHTSKLKSENVRPLSVNNYWVPDDWIEDNVWLRFKQRFQNLIDGKRIANQRIKISDKKCNVYNQSSTNVGNILSDSTIDFIFTDPPYGDSIQYDELSMVWNFWFKKEYEHSKEIIINKSKNKDIKAYESMLSEVFAEAHRVLKDEKYMIVTFHNKDFKVWTAILRAIKNAGFLFEGLNIHDPLGNSFNKNWAKRSPKTDMYMLFRKTIRKKQNQISMNFDKAEIEDYINKKMEEKGVLNLALVYDDLLERIIQYVFETEDYESFKNINIYLVDKMSKL